VITAQPHTSRPPKDVRLIYLAPKDVLIARVARKCMMQLCEALTQLGVDVELICLKVKTVSTEPTRSRSVWDVYGIEHRFRLSMIPTPLRQERMDGRGGRLAVLFYRLTAYPAYALRAYVREGAGRHRRTVFYSRNYGCIAAILPLRALLRDRARTIIEMHVPPRGRLQHAVLRRVDGVACQSKALQTVMIESGRLRENNSVSRHTGFSPSLTECVRADRAEARVRLGWAADQRVACYTGKIAKGMQEIELLLQTAEKLQGNNIRFVFVGGRADQLTFWRDEVSRRGIRNVDFVGFVAPADALLYQMAADVLLLYYPSSIELNDYRSPGKLFEYMASGTPAVISDYRSIREVVRDGENGLLVPPDRPDLLADAVARLLEDAGLASRLAEQAKADVMMFTWQSTAAATLALVDLLWSE
jgi:glycosyltransferase involved in cell wall biosynthesis